MKKKYEKTFTFEGKRYHVYGDTLEEAIEKKALKLRDLEEHRIILDKHTKVSDWMSTCLTTYKIGISDQTKVNLDIIANKHILPYIGHMEISYVKPVMCQQILNNLDGYSKSYIIKVHQLLCFCFKMAYDNQLILSDPTKNLIRPDGHTTHRRAITETERRYLLQVCYDDPRMVPFLFMLYCGCRPGEALKVQSNDIRMIEGVKALHIKGTKTANADRYVPIPLDFLKYLEGIDPGGFALFATKLDGQPHTQASYKWLSGHLKRAMNIAMGCKVYRNKLMPPYPLAADFEPYCLRHTYCTDLKKAGVPLGIAKDYMGHADIATTANIYSHSDNETFLAGAEILIKNLCSDMPSGTTLSTTFNCRKLS